MAGKYNTFGWQMNTLQFLKWKPMNSLFWKTCFHFWILIIADSWELFLIQLIDGIIDRLHDY